MRIATRAKEALLETFEVQNRSQQHRQRPRPYLTAIRCVGAVSPGSELWLYNTVPVNERQGQLRDNGNKKRLALKNLELKHVFGSPTSRDALLRLKPENEFGVSVGDQVSAVRSG